MQTLLERRRALMKNISNSWVLTYKNSAGFKLAGQNIVVNWGDGTNDWTFSSSELQTANHTYADNAIYTVTITGDIEALSFRNELGLISIKTKLPNIPMTRFDTCFFGCSSLISIPSGLFDNCTRVTNFNNCFYLCRNLTSIPSGLFDNCTSVTSFSGCFYGCSSLTSIPSGLFDNCTLVTNFSSCFNGCSSLTSIPSGLFDNCTSVTDFGNCFYDCSSLTSIPLGLFDNCTSVTNFYRCFYGCSSIISDVPNLWYTEKWSQVRYHNGCFFGCTNAQNYADIPSDWK